MYHEDSQGCQMHITNFLKPFGWAFNVFGVIITIMSIISIIATNGGSGSGNSDSSGFEL